MSSSREAIRYLTLFAAEEIPAAIVTYVALLMLLQLGMALAEATLCSALLFVPWVLKSFMHPWVIRVGHFRGQIHLVEVLLFVSLVLLALSFEVVNGKWLNGKCLVFFALLLVSLLCAWYELVARMYYERMVRPGFRRLLTVPKHICSQVAVIFTYGALIFLVGMLQVYFRQIRYSWALGCYVAAGLFLLFMFLHLMTLAPSPTSVASSPIAPLPTGNRPLMGSASEAKREAACTLPQRGSWMGFPVLILFLLLLPQALMFHARVLYLYDAHAQGGLQCTIQEIGFAQGTVGVIAFSLGLFLSRRLLIKQAVTSTFQLFNFSTFSLVLSPFVYLGMTILPPQSLLGLCLCTTTAQFLFGFGLGACRLPIRAISGTRYAGTVNMLQIPVVSAAMIAPMAISGWLVEQLGYSTYFLINALTAPVCLLGVYVLKRQSASLGTSILHKSNL